MSERCSKCGEEHAHQLHPSYQLRLEIIVSTAVSKCQGLDFEPSSTISREEGVRGRNGLMDADVRVPLPV